MRPAPRRGRPNPFAAAIAPLKAAHADAPPELRNYVIARAVLVHCWRSYTAAGRELGEATRALYRVSERDRVGRARAVLAVEERRAVFMAACDAFHACARFVGGRREAFAVLRARRDRAAEGTGRPPPPLYVLPEERGDAWEPSKAPAETWRERVRGELARWSRLFVSARKHMRQN